MSYILNALRRADRERRQDPLAGPIPASSAAIESPSISAATAQWPWILMGIALALGVAGWLMMLLRPTAPAAPQPIVIVTPAAPVAAVPDSLEALATETGDEPVYDSLDDLAIEPELPESVAPAVDTAAATVLVPEPVPERGVNVETIQLQPPDSELTLLKNMPADFRAAFPPLLVEVHVYDREPARRFVRINGQRYLEGDVLDAGPQIETINEAGIVFRFRGERVLLPSGG